MQSCTTYLQKMVLNDDHTVVNMEMFTRKEGVISDTIKNATAPRDNSPTPSDTASIREYEARKKQNCCQKFWNCSLCCIFLVTALIVGLVVLIIILTPRTGCDSDGYDSDGYDSDW